MSGRRKGYALRCNLRLHMNSAGTPWVTWDTFLRMFLHLDKFRGYLDFGRDEGVEYDRGILPA